MATQLTTFTTRAGARPGSRLGSGGTIIAVHGAISDHRSWTLFANDLASSFHVIAFTQRGFGSEAGQPLDVDAHAGDLIEIATQAEHPVHVIGWSYGCEVAINAILRQPSLFARLVLFDPSVGSIMDGDSAFAEAEGAFRASLAPVAEKLHQKRAVDAALAFSDAVCGGRRENTDPFLEATVRDNAPSLGPFLSMTPRARTRGRTIVGATVGPERREFATALSHDRPTPGAACGAWFAHADPKRQPRRTLARGHIRWKYGV